MIPSSSTVLVVFGYLVLLTMVVPEVKSAPFGFGLLCDTDYFEDLLCGLFDSCEDETEEEEEEETPMVSLPTTIASTTTTTGQTPTMSSVPATQPTLTTTSTTTPGSTTPPVG